MFVQEKNENNIINNEYLINRVFLGNILQMK